MNYKNDEIKVISQNLNILKWEKEFEDTLRLKQKKDLELYPVDKLWFEEYKNSVLSDEIPMNKKIENYNSFKPLNNANILHDKNSINPNSNFIFLNKQNMDDFSPSVLSQKQFNITIIGRFYNGKMISRIGKNLYYCFFIDNDKINEGIFMFGNIDISSINPIINEFLNSNFEIFKNKYFHENDISSNNHFYVYHRNEFDFLIKKNENNDNYYRASNLKKINIPKNMKNKENNNVNNKQNFKQIIPSKIKFIKTDNKSILNNELEKKYINPLEPNYISNLSKCIFEFYYSEQIVNDFINGKKKFREPFKIINEKWLNKFKNIILYDQIKLKLSNENNSLKYKEIISDFINNNININDIRIDYIPLTKKIISNKNGKEYFYYNNFQLLTKNSFSEFCKTFHFQIINKEFNTFLLDKKNIFIQYDENCGEILYYNDSNFEHNYFLISDYHLKEILNFLQKNGLERGLSFYGFKGFNGYIKEWKLTDKNNQIIGILKILNNNIKFNKYNNYNSDEEIINNDENVLGNNSNENQRNSEENNVYFPKIIKNKRILNGNNTKNIENGKGDKQSQSFIKSKKNIKETLKTEENGRYNYYNDNNDSISDNNITETMKNLRSSKIDKKYNLDESEEIINETGNINSKERKLNETNQQFEDGSNNFHNSNKSFKLLDTNKTSESGTNKNNKKNVKDKMKTKEINTPPQKSKITSKIRPHKLDKDQEKFIISPKSISPPKIDRFNNDNEIMNIPKKNSRNNLSPKTTNVDKMEQKKLDINKNRQFLSPKSINDNKKRKFERKFDFNSDDEYKKTTFNSPIITNNNIYNKKNKSPIILPRRPSPPPPPIKKLNPPGLTGLQNIGATCYMNATLQCFSNVPRFREGILELKNNKSNKKLLSLSLNEVFKNLWRNKNIKYYAPYDFKELISEMNPLFRGINANDSKDLILFLLETIHRELNIKKNSVPIQKQINSLDFNSVFNGFVEEYKNGNESIVSEEFYGYFVSVMKCCFCNSTTYNVQITNILFFPLEKVRLFTKTPYNYVTLEDCFKQYEEPALFSGTEQIYCIYCKNTTNAYNQNKLITSPKTLIINLNRGKGLEFKVGIKFEEYLDIKNYLMINNGNSYYELIGVLSHFGENNMGGHFIAYCKNSYDAKWYKFNDAKVDESSFQEASSIGLPYVLYYSIIQS